MNFKKVRFASINLTLLIPFFFYRKQQIASWDGINRENFVFTSVCFRSGLSS